MSDGPDLERVASVLVAVALRLVQRDGERGPDAEAASGEAGGRAGC